MLVILLVNDIYGLGDNRAVTKVKIPFIFSREIDF